MAAIRYKKLYQQISPLLSKNDFFLNIGANDGVTNDPIYDFIAPFELRGFAIEPTTDAYNRLVENYKNFAGVQCIKAAIYSNTKEPLFRVNNELLKANPALSQITTSNKPQLIASLRKLFHEGSNDNAKNKVNLALLDKQHPIESMLVEDTEVAYLSFEDLCGRYNVTRVDILNLDAEGEDYNIFMSIDLDIWKPKAIIVETMFFNAQQLSLFLKKMTRHGYKYIQKFEYYSDVYLREYQSARAGDLGKLSTVL